ncbi:hypothetical protein N7472_010997 [Penicillium cf. griseofulvum]|uniref:Uncharacterized protein n=1 Tax=Penicillium cf. griseofulvum TaxID=2972120 RepID=A0A9W9M3Q5_9EURO|nr:hypothetical protein N7472_010997 [Penicillium cf. griseofulvum]
MSVDVYCAWGAGLGLGANWSALPAPGMLPQSKLPYFPPRRGGRSPGDPIRAGFVRGAPPPVEWPAPSTPGKCPREGALVARFARVCLPLASQLPSPGRHSDHLPRRANWRPSPPPSASPGPGKGAATRHRGPVAPGPGDQRPPAARGRVGAGASGLPTRGSPCQGPHSKIPRRPNMPHPTQRSHDGELQSPRPGPFGQVRFYTNPPTPFGV